MGKPNWQRLAELGQLPDYIKEELPASFSEANENAIRSKNYEPNKGLDEVLSDNEDTLLAPDGSEIDPKTITEVSDEDVLSELQKKSKSDLQKICIESGLDSTGNKEDLIERILPSKKEVKEETKEETNSEFIDEILR